MTEAETGVMLTTSQGIPGTTRNQKKQRGIQRLWREYSPVDTLICLLASITMRESIYIVSSHSYCGVLLQQPWETNTANYKHIECSALSMVELPALFCQVSHSFLNSSTFWQGSLYLFSPLSQHLLCFIPSSAPCTEQIEHVPKDLLQLNLCTHSCHS